MEAFLLNMTSQPLVEREYMEYGQYDQGSQNDSYTDLVTVEQEVQDGFRRFRNFLDLYMTPVIVALGLLGNMTSFAVFTCSYLRHYSSNVYMAALAVSDSAFLVCLLLNWCAKVGLHLYNREYWCQGMTFMTYVASFLSVWYVVAFTVERYIAVCYPFRRQQMCTVRKARIVVIVFAVAAVLLYFFSFFTFDTLYNQCLPKLKYYTFVRHFSNIDTLLTFAIPVFSIIGCNIRIAYKLYEFYHTRNELVNRGASVSLTQAAGTTSSSSSHLAPPPRQNAQMKVTQMLLVVSTVFILFNLPSHILRTHLTVMQMFDPRYKTSQRFNDCYYVFYTIYNLNFAVNFLLYSVSGGTFRKALVWLLRRCRYKMMGVTLSDEDDGGLTRKGTRAAAVTAEDIPLTVNSKPSIRSALNHTESICLMTKHSENSEFV